MQGPQKPLSNAGHPGRGQSQQQQSARTNSSYAAPTLAELRSAQRSSSRASGARSRVQQAASAVPDGSHTAAGSNLRSRLLMPLASSSTSGHAASPPQQHPAGASGLLPQLFSVFTNPLSSAAVNPRNDLISTSSQHSRADNTITAHHQPEAPDQLQDQSACATAPASDAAAAAAGLPDSAAPVAGALHASTTNDSSASGKGCHGPQHLAAGLQWTYRFEVHAAGSDPREQLVDYNGHDQHDEQQLCDAGGQLQQQLGASSIQQYVYDEDTGQLCRTGEGAETTRVGRHYLEDCHTGEFFQLAQQPTSGCWAWLRRQPRLTAEGWFQRDGVAGGMQQQEPGGILHSLSDFLDTMGSGMAALGLFSQGLAGGLAVLCLFMTYIQYATAGRDGFLAFYSPQAEMINRAFFALISVSLVAATSRHAYDKLGDFCPRHLRLGVVDGLVMVLYFLAYTCNLLATPLDDQLALEARRDPKFFTLPMPTALERRLGLWHALNLTRVVACGLAWVLVCYRSNHFVMLKVFEARRSAAAAGASVGHYQAGHSSTAAGVGSGVGGGGGGVGGANGGVPDSTQRLQRMGSNVGSSFADRGRAAAGGGARSAEQQQQWAVRSVRRSASIGGGGGSPCGGS